MIFNISTLYLNEHCGENEKDGRKSDAGEVKKETLHRCFLLLYNFDFIETSMYHLLSDKLESMEIITPEGFNNKPEGVAQGFIIEFSLILICLRVNDIPL